MQDQQFQIIQKILVVRHPDGSIGRGVQYPFIKPLEGEYHEDWDEDKIRTMERDC